MTWNYRLCKITHGEDRTQIGIYEVYYENGKPVSRTENPSYPLGEDATEFNSDMNAYIRATVLPVLEEIDGKLVEIK